MTLASVKAVKLGHSIDRSYKIGCVFGLTPVYAYSANPEDSIKAFKAMDRDWYQIDAMAKGAFPEYKLKAYRDRGVDLEISEEDRSLAMERIEHSHCDRVIRILFEGDENEWSEIDYYGFDNTETEKENPVFAETYFYSATKPQSAGQFWHYAADGTPVIWE